MRLATWNVNGLRARFEYMQGWLEARRPDVVGLQEIKLQDDLFPHQDLAGLGYRAFCHGQKAWNGVAVLVRQGLEAEVSEIGLPGQAELGARLLAVAVEGVVFITVYCPNGKAVEHPDFKRKLAWFDGLADHLGAHHDAADNLVLCGDFNICPAAIDSWDEAGLAGSIFHTEEERARMRRLADWGLCDVYRSQYPERQAFSWWDYRGGAFRRGHGLRIDLVLATAAVAGRVTAAEIDRDFRKKRQGLTASDHAPVYIDLV
jgi:exodeoxyribonuclease-3